VWILGECGIGIEKMWPIDADQKVMKIGALLFHTGQSHRPSLFCVFHCKTSSEGHLGERSMLIHLHSQAIITPKIWADIQVSEEPAWVSAERFGSTEQTVSGTVCG
jgi:hypothetical protein